MPTRSSATFPGRGLAIVIALATVAVSTLIAPLVSDKRSDRAARRRVYVLIDAADPADRDFLSGVKGARNSPVQAAAPTADTDIVVLTMKTRAAGAAFGSPSLRDELCAIPDPLLCPSNAADARMHESDTRAADSASFVLGPNTTGQMCELYDTMVGLCEQSRLLAEGKPTQGSCRSLETDSCPKRDGVAKSTTVAQMQWNIHFLAGNVTGTVPSACSRQNPCTTDCCSKAGEAFSFALNDNKAQGKALLAQARKETSYPIVLLKVTQGSDIEYASDVEHEIVAAAAGQDIRTCEVSLQSGEDGVAKMRECIDRKPEVGAMIALTDPPLAYKVLDTFTGYREDIAIIATDTWTPHALMRRAMKRKGTGRVCVLSTRHNATLKKYVWEHRRQSEVPDPDTESAPANWRAIEFVRYSLGWDLFLTYAALSRGERQLQKSWQFDPDGGETSVGHTKDTRTSLSINMNARPIWAPEAPFTPCCTPRSGNEENCER